MASYVFPYGVELLSNALLNLDTADLRTILCMTNTTVDTEIDKSILSGFTTLDKCDGANHPANGDTLAATTVTRTTGAALGATYVTFDATDWAITALGAGTRSNQGVLVFLWDTTLNGSHPVAWLEFAASWNGDGSNRTIVWPTTGLFRFKFA